MEIKEGMKVKLKTFEEINQDESPIVVGKMKDYLGKIVTIDTIYSRRTNKVIFSIKEDGHNGKFRYGSHCIEGTGSIIPEDLFEI